MPYYTYMDITKNGEKNYYCNLCKHIHTKNTLMDKYGVDNVMKLESVKSKHLESIKNIDYKEADDKRKETVKSKYGVEYVQHESDDINLYKTYGIGKKIYIYKNNL